MHIPKLEKREVAFTKSGSNAPAYINIQRKDDTVTIIVRGDARADGSSPHAHIEMSFEEWRVLFRDIQFHL